MGNPQLGAEPGELLPGEDSRVRDAVEVEHWIALYEERKAIWEQRHRRARDPAQHRELERYLEWVSDRIRFWRERHADLTGLHLDAESQTLAGRRSTVPLTRREFQLLAFLADHPGRHFPASLLVARAWADSDLCEEQLRTYLVRLRRKLEFAGAPSRIVAERPKGYVLVGDDREERSTSPLS